MVFTICYWHLQRFHQSQDARNKSPSTKHMQQTGSSLNGLSRQARPHLMELLSLAIAVTDWNSQLSDWERRKTEHGEWESFRETKENEKANKVVTTVQLPSSKSTQLELKSVRLFRLINDNSCHLVRKPSRGLHPCRACTRQSVPQSLYKSTQVKALEQKACEGDYSRLN